MAYNTKVYREQGGEKLVVDGGKIEVKNDGKIGPEDIPEIDKLTQEISDGPTQEEVQNIQEKVNKIIDALHDAGIAVES